jgi:tRNA-intron endonuclease, archaea type
MVFPIYLPELSSNSAQAITLAKEKMLGERKQGKVVYSVYEAAHLIESGKANLVRKSKIIPQSQSLKILLKNAELNNNYLVFKDLRKKGYIPKIGLKFGVEFRVYEKHKPHATYLTYITTEKAKINLREFISKNRTAHSTAKSLLMAVIDSEQDIIYYKINWTKLV